MDDYTSCLLQGYGIVPSAPRRLRVSNVDVNFALFHWEPPKDLADTVIHYNVFYRLVDDEYDSITNVHSPFILEHLNANTLYEVYVEAVNGHGAGEPSQRVVFSTKSQVYFYFYILFIEIIGKLILYFKIGRREYIIYILSAVVILK